MRKTLSLFLALIVISTLMLSACSKNENASNSNGGATGATGTAGSAGSSGSTETATKLEFWTFNELHEQFYQHMKDLWNAANPDRQIDLVANVYPYDDMHNKLLLALQSGTGAPDLADIELNKFSNFLKGTPQLLELNDIVEPDINNIVQSRLDIYAKDGKYYGIDFHVGASVIYYNKEIFDKAGVNIDDIKTWDDYYEAGKIIVEKTGVPITTIETGDMWSIWPQVAQAAGNNDFQTADGQVNFTGPEVVNALSFQQKLIRDGLAIPTPGSTHHAEEYYGFMNSGGAASVWMPMWYMNRFTDYMPDLKNKIVIKPMPAWKEGDPRSAGMGGTGTVVTKTAKNVELAKDFLAFSKISREGNIEIWTQLGFDPLRSDVWDAPELRADNKFTDYYGKGIFDILLEVKDEIEGVIINETTPMISDEVKTSVLVRALIDNEDVTKVLEDAQKAIK